MKRWFARLRNRGLAVQSAALGVWMLAACALVAPVAAWHSGPAGMITAAVAATFCLLGAEAALVLARRFRGPESAWKGMLLGMLPRMGIPLVFGVICQLRGGMLAQAGLLVYLVVFYPVALWAETILCLRGGAGAERPRGVSRSAAL
jgi:hypothetical protein